MQGGSFTNCCKPYDEVRASSCIPSSVLVLEAHHDLEHALESPSGTVKFHLKETRNSYFCVIPQNQVLHESASLFLK